MKTVSNAYKEGMRGLLRERSYARISFGNVDVDAARDGVWASNGAEAYSEVDTVDYSYHYEEMVATLELNRWALDGGAIILPESGGVNDGFVSSRMSRSDGTFSTPPVLTRVFSEPHTFQGLTVTFDTRTGEWPRGLTAEFWKEGSVAETVTAEPDGVTYTIETRQTDVDKVVITFTDMLPYRRARVQYVLYGVGEIFTNDDLVEVRQTDDVDPLSRRLPSEKLTFTILDYRHRYDPDNPQGVYQYVDVNAPVSVQYGYTLGSGEIEWLKPDKYLLDAKPTVQKHLATFNATGLIGRLSNVFYKSKLGTKTLYDMAEEVLLDADLTLTEQGERPWDIDDTLKDMTTTAVLPIATHMNCLQLIAHAARCRLYSDDDNIIHIEPFGVTVTGIYSGEFSDNGHLSYSEWDSVYGGDSSTNSYATLELNRWVLDGGNQVILPAGQTEATGYISQQMTSATGAFASAPVFTRTFDVKKDIPVLGLTFDGVLNEHPLSVEVKYYSDAVLVDTQTVTGIDSTSFTVKSALAQDITKLEVKFLSGLPYRRARVSSVYFRETDFTLDFSSIVLDTQQVSKIDRLKAVNVAKYSYMPEESDGGGSSYRNVDEDAF